MSILPVDSITSIPLIIFNVKETEYRGLVMDQHRVWKTLKVLRLSKQVLCWTAKIVLGGGNNLGRQK